MSDYQYKAKGVCWAVKYGKFVGACATVELTEYSYDKLIKTIEEQIRYNFIADCEDIDQIWGAYMIITKTKLKNNLDKISLDYTTTEEIERYFGDLDVSEQKFLKDAIRVR